MQDVNQSPVKDNEWFTMHIIVQGRHVVVNVKDKQVVDWTETQPANPPSGHARPHDRQRDVRPAGPRPQSTVYYRNIRVKPLFPIVDYHLHAKGGLTIDDIVKFAKEHAIRAGVADNCGVGFPTTNDQALQQVLAGFEGKPCTRRCRRRAASGSRCSRPRRSPIRLRLHGLDDLHRPAEASAIRLWIAGEVEVGDKQAFMDMLVEKTVGILNNEPIDIYVNPTFLPEAIAEEYDTLWTDARMDRVIEAAVKNGVAIEINARYKLPSEKFLRKAKAAGTSSPSAPTTAAKTTWATWPTAGSWPSVSA